MPRTQIKGPDIESTSLESKISNDIDFTKVETERINLTSVNPADTATFFGTDDSGNSTLHMRIGNGSGDKIQVESWNGSSATSLMEVGQTTVTIKGDLVVSGTTTTVNSETLEVGDNFIILNSGVTGSPTLDAGIKVERGSETDATFKWNETEDKWEADSGLIVGGNIRTAVGSGLSDVDGDTYVTTEETADEDIIRIYTGGSEKVTISADGLDVNGTLEVGTGSRGALLKSTAPDNFELRTYTNTPNPNLWIGYGNGSGGQDTSKEYISMNAGIIKLANANLRLEYSTDKFGFINSENNIHICQNAYYDGEWKAIAANRSDAAVIQTNLGGGHIFRASYASGITSANQVINWALKAYIDTSGSMYIDGTYNTFSPIMPEDVEGYGWLEVAKEDAYKPHKPDTLKLQDMTEDDIQTYSKDATKIAMANTRLLDYMVEVQKENTQKINQLIEQINNLQQQIDSMK